jgi:hypothetical protein
MKRIVERCPSCGVEHDHQVHECEACGNAVRHWCRTHSREIGWLESPWCTRCEEEAARRERRDPRPAPVPAPPRAPAAAPQAERPAAGVPHEGVAAVLKARLKEAVERPATPPAAPPAFAPPEPPTARMPPAAAPAPTAPAAAPAAPREPEKPRPPRRGLGVRLYESLLTVLMTGIVGALIGVVVGGIMAYRAGTEIPLEAGIVGSMGGMAGLGLGVLIAAVSFPRTANRPEK